MSAPVRPSVTDNARAEAERRWPRLYGPEETLNYPREAVREHTRLGFMAGAEWANRAVAAEDKLAAVEALLGRWHEYADPADLQDDLRAALAAPTDTTKEN